MKKPQTGNGQFQKDNPHWFSNAELADISGMQGQLSATSVLAHSRKFNGSTGCTCAGVRSITIRTKVREK
jgi:hypothetical protein